MGEMDQIKCFVLDMDGTIYLEGELFSFTKDFLTRVEETGRKYYFFTNNSSKSQQDYIDELAGLGRRILPLQMMISSHVAVRYLKRHYPQQTIYVVGTPSLIEEFQMAGMNLVQEDPNIVLLGFDTTLTYEKVAKACHYVRNGCIYYGVNPDWNRPMKHGNFISDCGSMAKMIEASAGRFPEFFGKPCAHTLDYIIEMTGYAPEETAVVGDRLYTDIAVADGSPVTSILVLSGKSIMEDAEKAGLSRILYTRI